MFTNIIKMDLFDEFQRMIDDAIAKQFAERKLSIRANAEMQETKGEVIVTVELPGVDKNDIKVEVTENSIGVKVEEKSKKEVKKPGFYKVGSRYFGFQAAYSTPTPIDPNSVTASYKNGVLEIRAKKIRAPKPAKRVAVT